MKRLSKPSRDTLNNDYLNFIKKNHLRMLAEAPLAGHHRSRSKGEEVPPEHKRAQNALPISQNKTLTIDIDEPVNEEIFPSGFNGSNFSSLRSQKKKISDPKLSNIDIESIIEDKKQSIMKIVYESVQISISNKKVLLKPQKTMLKGQKKSIVRLIDFQREVNDAKETKEAKEARESKERETIRQSKDGRESLLKLPDISQRKDAVQQFPRLLPSSQVTNADDITSTTICYNDYIRNNYLDVNISQGFDRKMSQQLPMAVRRKRISYPTTQRYQENEKLIQTFYEYERLMQLKQLRVQQNRIKLNQESRKSKDERKPSTPTKRLTMQQGPRLDGGLNQSEQELLNGSDDRQLLDEKTIDQDPSIVKELDEQALNDTEPQQLPNCDSQVKKPGRPLPKPKNYLQKERQMTVYEHKISTYRDFIFKVNFAHNRFDPLILKDDLNYHKSDYKFKAYVGKGNNSLLIRSLLKRRFWWSFDDDSKNCHFVWTQLKVNSCFEREKPCELDYCLDEQEKSPRLSKKKKSQPPANQQSRSKLKPELPKGHDKIFNSRDRKLMEAFDKMQLEPHRLEDMDYRVKFIEKKLLPIGNASAYVVHNHLECNYYIGNKKAMFYNLRQYYGLIGQDVFDHLPLTFHIKKGLDDKEYKNFVKYFKKREQMVKAYESEEDDERRGRSKQKKPPRRPRNIWIVKPGEISNRGNGITVIDELYELNKILKSKDKHPNGNDKTYIVQAYLDRPLLYHRRKFDLRHYMLITTLYGRMKAYWYSQGYIRTSSCEFNLNDLGDSMIHLTNDAIQKYGSNYGRYEEGNKISYAEFQRYLDQTMPDRKLSFYDSIYPKMREVARDAVRSAYLRMDPRRLQHNFEVFGLDFMIDQEFNVWLIEINTNPCLEISSGLLGRIIPTMVEHAFRLSLDVLFPPVAHYPNTQKHLAPDNALDNLKFELIFDEQVDGQQLRQLYKSVDGLDCGQIDEEQETYENDGKQCDQEDIV